jgi:D-glycero-D-manno-heptose 1,7-bisphosphate phosphatase
MGRPAVFLDRDGTIVREVEYLRSPRQLRLLPRAGEAIRLLNRAGFAVVVTTNQSGIGRGLLTEEELEDIHAVLRSRLARRGARIDGIYFCPHHPEAARPEYRRRCRCRKPAPGMLLRAARELDLDLGRCFAIGDSARDIEAGRRAGCRAVLVRTGYGAETEARLRCRPGADYVADDMFDAVAWILQETVGWRRAGKTKRR